MKGTFFLVCTGCGERMSDITPDQYEAVLSRLADAQNEYPGMMVRQLRAPKLSGKCAFLPETQLQVAGRGESIWGGFIRGGCAGHGMVERG